VCNASFIYLLVLGFKVYVSEVLGEQYIIY